MTRMFNPTVGSSATSANRRHSRLPLQADLAAARGIVTTWRATASKPPSTSPRPGFASASRGKVDGELPSIPIAAQGSGRVGPLRGFLPRGLSNACPHASSCPHGAADKGRRRTTLNDSGPTGTSRVAFLLSNQPGDVPVPVWAFQPHRNRAPVALRDDGTLINGSATPPSWR